MASLRPTCHGQGVNSARSTLSLRAPARPAPDECPRGEHLSGTGLRPARPLAKCSTGLHVPSVSCRLQTRSARGMAPPARHAQEIDPILEAGPGSACRRSLVPTSSACGRSRGPGARSGVSGPLSDQPGARSGRQRAVAPLNPVAPQDRPAGTVQRRATPDPPAARAARPRRDSAGCSGTWPCRGPAVVRRTPRARNPRHT